MLLQKLPFTVAEVVENSPSLTRDGGLVVGSRHTTVFMVHAETGQLVRAFAEVGGALEEMDPPQGTCHPLLYLPSWEHQSLPLCNLQLHRQYMGSH